MNLDENRNQRFIQFDARLFISKRKNIQQTRQLDSRNFKIIVKFIKSNPSQYLCRVSILINQLQNDKSKYQSQTILQHVLFNFRNGVHGNCFFSDLMTTGGN